MAQRGAGSETIADRLPPAPDNLILTKEEVARRELDQAIKLFFSDGDPVSIHVLACASREIIWAVGRAKGAKTTETSIEVIVSDEYQAVFRDLMNESFNFMKHGARDALKTHDRFHPRMNEIVLLMSTQDFINVFGTLTIAMAAYQIWSLDAYPEVLTDRGRVNLTAARQVLSGGRPMTKSEYDQQLRLAYSIDPSGMLTTVKPNT